MNTQIMKTIKDIKGSRIHTIPAGTEVKVDLPMLTYGCYTISHNFDFPIRQIWEEEVQL